MTSFFLERGRYQKKKKEGKEKRRPVSRLTTTRQKGEEKEEKRGRRKGTRTLSRSPLTRFLHHTHKGEGRRGKRKKEEKKKGRKRRGERWSKVEGVRRLAYLIRLIIDAERGGRKEKKKGKRREGARPTRWIAPELHLFLLEKEERKGGKRGGRKKGRGERGWGCTIFLNLTFGPPAN